MKRFLRWIGWLATALVLLVVGVTVAGMFLPERHALARTVRLQQPPEVVWGVVSDYGSQPQWRKDAASVERMPDHNGKELWKITTTHGSWAYLRTAKAEPPRWLVIETLTDADGPPFITWHFDLAADDGGTRVTIHESGDFGNPYTRFMVRYVLGQTKFVDDYLTYLAQKFGEPASIENAASRTEETP